MRFLYMITKLQMRCPIIPDEIDTVDYEEFGQWIAMDPGDYPGFPFHNGLKVFLWFINDFGDIYEEEE